MAGWDTPTCLAPRQPQHPALRGTLPAFSRQVSVLSPARGHEPRTLGPWTLDQGVRRAAAAAGLQVCTGGKRSWQEKRAGREREPVPDVRVAARPVTSDLPLAPLSTAP
eukprot:132211-Rhodomonas_salina.2